MDNNTGARFKDLHQFQPDLDTVSSNMLRYDPSIRGSALLQENRGECWQQAFNRWTRVFQVQGAQSCERYGTNTVGLIVGPGALMLITEKHILRVKELLSE
ncbi:MAG: hypothetical protein HY559_02180 [Gammaproteobacteria bacterium]|nr:hypothetical protein [Gammaproteobacteria bacterium]